VEIVEVDPSGFRRAYGIIEEAAHAGREFPTGLPAGEALELLTNPPPDHRFTALACVHGAEPVVSKQVVSRP
jgi:hypothetical protein